MNNWAPIKYMGFWDVPLIILIPYKQELFLFDCAFDEALDDYSDSYKVYTLPDLKVEELPADWTKLHLRANRYLGEVPVSKVQFDPTRRRAIDTTVLDELAAVPRTG
jgi:hypothetical protein